MTENTGMKGKVSVILPSLNVGEYIDEALNSVCRQTLSEIEIICIDAGSTDGTWKIIKEAESRDDRIRAIQCDVKSYGYQVNLGIMEACGEYIAVLETDDFAHDDMYEKLYEAAMNHNADYAKADYEAFVRQDNGEYYFFPRHTFSDPSMYGRALVPKEYTQIQRDDWYLWQGIYKREFIVANDIRLSETSGAAFQDIGFLALTGMYAKRAVYLCDLLYCYRIDRDEASSKRSRGIKYSYNEYKNVIDQITKRNMEILAYRCMLYTRMARSFVSGYNRISDSERKEGKYREELDWFRECLKGAIEGNMINEEVIGQGLWKRLTILLGDENQYHEKFLRAIDDGFFGGHDRVVIFGCGEFGYKAYLKITSMGRKVVGFWDNNEALIGKSINGIKINGVMKADEVGDDLMVIIANEAHYDEIREQLVKNGFSDKRIRVFM